MSVTAYTSSVVNPGPGNLVDKVIDLAVTALPVAGGVQLYGVGIDTQEATPPAVWTYAWKLLDQPVGSTAVFEDTGTTTSALQNPKVININLWGNYRCQLIVTNTNPNPDRASDDDPNNPGQKFKYPTYAMPSSAFVHIRLQSPKYGLEKPAATERNWHLLFRKVVEKLEAMSNYAKAAVGVLGLIELEDAPVDAAHPKAITQERIKLQASIDGTRTALGFAPGVVGVPSGANVPLWCAAWYVKEALYLETFEIALADGGLDVGGGEAPYIFKLYTGTKADLENNTMAVLSDGGGNPASVTADFPPLSHGPLLVDSVGVVGGPWLLVDGICIALLCTQAPASAGGGATVVLHCTRRV